MKTILLRNVILHFLCRLSNFTEKSKLFYS